MKHNIWAPTTSGDLDGLAPRSPLLDAKVMMVDDEPLMTDLIRTHLEDEGYVNFVVSNDPRQALELLRREDPGVLLLDLMMPKVSGFELLEAMRADRALRYVPVIVLTASTGADSKLRALQLGASDFLSKPVDASELVLRVRNTLAFRQYHERLINFDPVTDLPNQRMFDRGLAAMLARRDAVGGVLTLLSVTVPEWRLLRESMGQELADRLASAIALRLERFVGSEGRRAPTASAEREPRVARLASDRFGVLLEGPTNAEAVEAAVKRLLAIVSEPVALGPHEVAPTAWVGISVAPADGHTVETLHNCADLAGSRAREEGAAQFKFASPELNARSYERMALGLQLRGAAQRGELRLHYQPKLDLSTSRIVGAEALVRWQHPELGLLPPDRFIPLAEELGLIGSIGQWVIERACHAAAGWARDGLGELKIAINVAKPQFLGDDLGAVLSRALLDSGLPARQVVLELTESMLMDNVQDALALMHELKALGVTLSIDDFGTGYSSLSYLKRLPLDELKIDRSFVADLPGCHADAAITRTVIDLGHSLGMMVTAEGVETNGQLECLSQLGCDQYQGFLFSKPLPASRFTELLLRELAPATP